MIRFTLLIVALLFAVALGTAAAQTTNPGNQAVPGNQGLIGTPQTQSITPPRSACTVGSQSLRVCDSDFQSCNSICTATGLDASADIAGCSLRCCNNFSACLHIRGCATTFRCF